MDKLFPDINEAKKTIQAMEETLPDRIRQELLNELPGRIRRNIDKGAYYIHHVLSRFPVYHTDKYAKAVKEVCDLLIAEGYHVEAYVEDYNGYYYVISMLISWDIEKVKSDKYTLKQYESCYEREQAIIDKII